MKQESISGGGGSGEVGAGPRGDERVGSKALFRGLKHCLTFEFKVDVRKGSSVNRANYPVTTQLLT